MSEMSRRLKLIEVLVQVPD